VLAAPVSDGVTVELGSSAAGKLEVRGNVRVRGGFQRLEFDNTRTVKRGATFALPVRASADLRAPLTLTWDRPA
jgi:hypothetical protein